MLRPTIYLADRRFGIGPGVKQQHRNVRKKIFQVLFFFKIEKYLETKFEFVSISYRDSETAHVRTQIAAGGSSLIVAIDTSSIAASHFQEQEALMIKNAQAIPTNGFHRPAPQPQRFVCSGGRQFPGHARVRWGSVTHSIPTRPETIAEVSSRLLPLGSAPRPHDVMIAEVQSGGRHAGIELDCGRKAAFDVGDILGVALGHRYATAQYLGEVPDQLYSEYHMLSQAGVCGRVVSAPAGFPRPTILRPLGLLAGEDGRAVNLRDFSLEVAPVDEPLPTVILVVGSSMDAGKTTTAAAVIRGLSRAGSRVNAGKLTGTACRKDLLAMHDAGAVRTIDFSSVGFASTAKTTCEELEQIAHVMTSQLASDSPDFIVLEIADGIIQKETAMLMTLMNDQHLFNHLVLAIHDAMSAPTCVSMLREKWGLTPTLISGVASQSPLSISEVRQITECRCLDKQALESAAIAELFSPLHLELSLARGSSPEVSVLG